MKLFSEYLPDELNREISSYLTLEDMETLRKTCRANKKWHEQYIYEVYERKPFQEIDSTIGKLKVWFWKKLYY